MALSVRAAASSLVIVLCTSGVAATPSAPTGLVASVSGSTVTLRWSVPFGAIGIRLEAGTRSGASNAAVYDAGAVASLTFTNVPSGTYYVRVRAFDYGGFSAGSNEVTIRVGGTVAPTPAPAPPPPRPAPRTFYVYGGFRYQQYLGYFTCLFCTEYGSNAINNRYGTYGSRYSPLSIRNEYGTYGSPYSTYSPCNRYASSPPIVVDNAGNYYGELTVNSYRSDFARSFYNWLTYDVCR